MQILTRVSNPPPPIPWTTLLPINIFMLTLTAHSRDPMRKITLAISRTGLRPKISLILPHDGVAAVSNIKYRLEGRHFVRKYTGDVLTYKQQQAYKRSRSNCSRLVKLQILWLWWVRRWWLLSACCKKWHILTHHVDFDGSRSSSFWQHKGTGPYHIKGCKKCSYLSLWVSIRQLY